MSPAPLLLNIKILSLQHFKVYEYEILRYEDQLCNDIQTKIPSTAWNFHVHCVTHCIIFERDFFSTHFCVLLEPNFWLIMICRFSLLHFEGKELILQNTESLYYTGDAVYEGIKISYLLVLLDTKLVRKNVDLRRIWKLHST